MQFDVLKAQKFLHLYIVIEFRNGTIFGEGGCKAAES